MFRQALLVQGIAGAQSGPMPTLISPHDAKEVTVSGFKKAFQNIMRMFRTVLHLGKSPSA